MVLDDLGLLGMRIFRGRASVAQPKGVPEIMKAFFRACQSGERLLPIPTDLKTHS